MSAILLAPDAHERGLARLTQGGGRVIEWDIDSASAIAAIAEADVVIDGILGLGGQGGLRATAQSALKAILPGTTSHFR